MKPANPASPAIRHASRQLSFSSAAAYPHHSPCANPASAPQKTTPSDTLRAHAPDPHPARDRRHSPDQPQFSTANPSPANSPPHRSDPSARSPPTRPLPTASLSNP